MSPKIPAAVFALLLAASAPAFAEHDPIRDALTPPEVALKHQQALGLSDEQVKTIEKDALDAQQQFSRAQMQLAGAVEKMASILKDSHVDQARALEQLDTVLRLEREVKRVQLTLMIQVKNTLTAQQQAMAHQFDAQDEK